jgi:hypothetical protein
MFRIKENLPEELVNETRVDMAGWNRVVDRTDDDGGEREDAERDEDTLYRVLDEPERLAGVNWLKERLA